jgi:hypothetical protein
MAQRSPTFSEIPLDVVGSTVFGRYPKISVEQTFNMIISDAALVPYAGYKIVANITSGQGRGLYASTNYGKMIAVVDDGVYSISNDLSVARIANIGSYNGDVFIAENNASEIAICDKSAIYIFNYANNTFQQASIDFLPGYISFQSGYFIAPDLNSDEWRLSDFNNGLSWPASANNVGEFQTKPNHPLAIIPVPGKGNLIFVFGSLDVEAWVNTGAQLFPYQKNTFFNIDYGCLNQATIAANEGIIVWLAANEKSGPTIMYSNGGDPQQISTDGINFKLAELTNPQNAYGFLFKQDGHTIYQFAWPDDNLSYIYDFTTQKFFTVCDQDMNFHIAKRVVFFNNNYYFVSFNDGNLYEMSSNYTTYDGEEIPRIRVTGHVRTPDSMPHIFNNVTFPIEQGDNRTISRVDLSVSVDGGESFSSYDCMQLNSLGNRQGQLIYWDLGYANDIVFQFRFWGKGRFVAFNGVANVYQ